MANVDIPKYGWKAKFDHIFPQKRSQKLSATWRQIITMLPLSLRYLLYWIKKWFFGRKPVMDFLKVAKNDQRSGVPFGGIGSGSIGRSFNGYFYNFRMLPGQYDPEIAVAMHFILTVQNSQNKTIFQSVLTGNGKRKCGILSCWQWNMPSANAEYTALYPRSWTEYILPELNLIIICKQISPVIPHNYVDSCIPGGVFEWIIQNNSNECRYVSITFTMNSVGENVSVESFNKNDKIQLISGVMINENNSFGKYSLALAGLMKDNVNVTKCSYFNPYGSGSDIWDSLNETGELKIGQNYRGKDKPLAIAVCCKTKVSSHNKSELAFSLTWDMPIFKFPSGNRIMKRYYTKFFDDSGKSGPNLCFYSLLNYKRWETEIDCWQKNILQSSLPEWYKSAIFNELYYITSGGTIWLVLEDKQRNKLPNDDPRIEYGRFAYLEGVEYRMYNTYDVHFYASIAITMLWPKLQLSLQYDIRDSIDFEDTSKIWYLYNGKYGFRKTKGTVPHDLGDSDEDPYGLINSYPIHDVSNWRDLNLKFVLQIYRDYIVTNSDIKFIKDMYPQMTTVMRRSLQWDIDGDGMIENSGEADQTYDCWIMSGTSAYCGSLWLAALVVFIEMANILEDFKIASEFDEILDKAKIAFNKKLWTGNYYKFDSSNSNHSNSIMADQLCGFWYLHCSKIHQKVISESNIKQSLLTLYKYNINSYYNGSQGCVNGMLTNFKIDKSSIQSDEVWIGVCYALASLFYYQGMTEEAFKLAEGIYKTIYEKSGLGFATPEALHNLDSFRSLCYMRPLSIWSIQLAIENSHQKMYSVK